MSCENTTQQSAPTPHSQPMECKTNSRRVGVLQVLMLCGVIGAICMIMVIAKSTAPMDSVGNEESLNPVEKRRLLDTLVWTDSGYSLYMDEGEFTREFTKSEPLPDIAALTTGGYVVTYNNKTGTSALQAIGQKYNSDGTLDGSEFLIDYLVDRTSVAALSGGGFVVTYVPPAVGGNTDIHVAVFPSSGYTPTTIFNIALTGQQSESSVAGLADDGFVVTFTQWLTDGDMTGVFAHIYNSSLSLVASFQVNSYTTGSQYNSHVASSPDGSSFVVTWQGSGQGGSGIDVMARRFSNTGVALSSEFMVNSNYKTNTQANPRVAYFPNGDHYVISYEGFLPSFGVRAKRYNSANDQPEGANNYTLASVAQTCNPSIATLSDDLFVVVFTRDAAGSVVEVNGTIFDVMGNKVGTPFQINTETTGQQTKARVAAHENQFMVVWQSNLLLSSTAYGVTGQLFYLV